MGMSFDSDSKATRLTASGAVFGGPARVVGIHYLASATAGTITVRDGGASGTVLAVFDTPASATATGFIGLSDTQLRCRTSAYVTLADVTAATVLYN